MVAGSNSAVACGALSFFTVAMSMLVKTPRELVESVDTIVPGVRLLQQLLQFPPGPASTLPNGSQGWPWGLCGPCTIPSVVYVWLLCLGV